MPTPVTTLTQASDGFSDDSQETSATNVVEDQASRTFLLSLLVEVVSVFIFGYIISRVLARQQRVFEEKQSAKVSHASQAKYLENIYKEIEENLRPLRPMSWQVFIQEDDLPEYSIRVSQSGGMEGTLESTTLDFLRNPEFKTTYWDAFVTSGLLPSVADSDTLAAIFNFYHNIRLIKAHLTAFTQRAEKNAEKAALGRKILEQIYGDSNKEFLEKSIIPLIWSTVRFGEDLLKKLYANLETLRTEHNIPISVGALPDRGQQNLGKFPSLDTFETVVIAGIDADKTYRHNSEQARYNIHIKLEPHPSKDWIKIFDLNKSELWSEVEGTPDWKITERYLLFYATVEELKENLQRISTAIHEANQRYQSRSKALKNAVSSEIAERNRVCNIIRKYSDGLDFTSPIIETDRIFQGIEVVGIDSRKSRILENGSPEIVLPISPLIPRDSLTDESELPRTIYEFELFVRLNQHPPEDWGVREGTPYRLYRGLYYVRTRQVEKQAEKPVKYQTPLEPLFPKTGEYGAPLVGLGDSLRMTDEHAGKEVSDSSQGESAHKMDSAYESPRDTPTEERMWAKLDREYLVVTATIRDLDSTIHGLKQAVESENKEYFDLLTRRNPGGEIRQPRVQEEDNLAHPDEERGRTKALQELRTHIQRLGLEWLDE